MIDVFFLYTLCTVFAPVIKTTTLVRDPSYIVSIECLSLVFT